MIKKTYVEKKSDNELIHHRIFFQKEYGDEHLKQHV
jgi:hypothetical protein